MCDIVCGDTPQEQSGRDWLHIDPGHFESGSMLTTSVDVGRIQEVRCMEGSTISEWLITSVSY